MKADKRYIKTEKLIRDEFYNLLKNEAYQDITIEKLCSNAIISKNTFYAHYRNKDQLFDTILNEFVNDLIENTSMTHSSETVLSLECFKLDIENIFDYIDKNRDIFFLFYKNDIQIDFSKRLAMRSKNASVTWLKNFSGVSELDKNIILLLDVFHSGIGSLAKSWITHYDEISIDEIKSLAISTQLATLQKIITLLS